MMKKRQKIRFGGANPITGILYACVISFALMYTVCRQQLLICTVIMCLATSAVYFMLFALHKKPIGSAIMTGILTTACFGVIAVIAVLFMDFSSAAAIMGEADSDSYIYFLFTASSKFTVEYAALTIALFSVVIGFFCCYFSVTMPRIGFLLLPALIPLILSTRTSQRLPMWLILILTASYIAAACCTARPYPNSGTAFTDKTSVNERAYAAICVAVAVTLVAAFVPKSEDTVFQQYLDDFAIKSPGFYNGKGLIGNFAMHSSVNTGFNSPSDEVLFTVQTDIPVNIDRWAFDVCNGENGWGYLGSEEMGYPDWEAYASLQRPAELFDTLISAAEDGKLTKYADILLDLPRPKLRKGTMFISAADSARTTVVLHPQNTYSISITDFDGKVYRTLRGEFFTIRDITAGKYLIKFTADVPCPEYSEALELIDFEQLLPDAVSEDVIPRSTALALLDEYRYAQSYKESTASHSPYQRIEELGRQITENCVGDYEKAAAIERWFGEQGFVYDLDYVPESADPEYFLFESNRGICSDFATSLTLLARAAGLSARYVEGFALNADNLNENGAYIVTEANAHAYTQIYIAGCGWVNFDATKYVFNAQQNKADGKTLFAALIITAACLAVLALVFLFRRPLAKGLFLITYPLRSKRSQIKGVYCFARSIACDISGRTAACTTVGDTRRIITNVLSLPKEAEVICTAADELLYSGGSVSIDSKELFCCLKRIRVRKSGMK
ncbi:MAG: transglutaminase family protein [Oscillospiraceae bacterium]